jgi:hypothetical protein
VGRTGLTGEAEEVVLLRARCLQLGSVHFLPFLVWEEPVLRVLLDAVELMVLTSELAVDWSAAWALFPESALVAVA